MGIFVGISQATPDRTTVDPAAGASARRGEGQGPTPSPVSTATLRRSHCSPRSYSLAASLSQSLVCLYLRIVCDFSESVHELNAFRMYTTIQVVRCVFFPSHPVTFVDANKDRPGNGLGIGRMHAMLTTVTLKVRLRPRWFNHPERDCLDR